MKRRVLYTSEAQKYFPVVEEYHSGPVSLGDRIEAPGWPGTECGRLHSGVRQPRQHLGRREEARLTVGCSGADSTSNPAELPTAWHRRRHRLVAKAEGTPYAHRVPAQVEKSILAHALGHRRTGITASRSSRSFVGSRSVPAGCGACRCVRSHDPPPSRTEAGRKGPGGGRSSQMTSRSGPGRFEPEYREQHIEVGATGERFRPWTNFLAGALTCVANPKSKPYPPPSAISSGGGPTVVEVCRVRISPCTVAREVIDVAPELVVS